MHIYGPANLHGAQPINSPHASRVTNRLSLNEASAIQDELQLSEAGQLVDKVRDLPEIRQERVDQIRAAIASGTYETDEKLGVAVGRLLDEIG